MSKNNPVIKSADKLILSRMFDAPRELVWQAWTDPAKLKLWFKPGDAFTTFSAKANVCIGGKYRIQLKKPDGEFYTVVGAYREIKAPERLVFTWAWEKDGSGNDFGEVEAQETLLTLEFKARDQQTELTLVQEQFASTESRDRHEQGWTGCLGQLAKFFGPCAGGVKATAGDAKNLIGKEFVITREYAAPREMVWRASRKRNIWRNGGGRVDSRRRSANGTRSRAIKFTWSCVRPTARIFPWAENFTKSLRRKNW